jgi:xylulokinase
MVGRDGANVLGIGIDGQMHGLVCLGPDLEPLHPAIIWADTRGQEGIAELAALQQAAKVRMPGSPAAGFAATSALWLRRHQPEILERTRVALCPKDVLRLRLTGEVATDLSDAAGTWLMDVAGGAWAPDVAAFCGLRLDQLPPIKGSTALGGRLRDDAAQVLGLQAGIPVVTGCADLAAQALGHGVIDPGVVLVTVGTGGQVVSSLAEVPPRWNESLYVFPHALPGLWYEQAAILAGGLALRWLRDLLRLGARPDAYALLSDLAAQAPAGAEGLLFLPYLAGERTPHRDAQAAGLFFGLRLHHEARHLARAVMEGVGFALQECLELVGGAAAAIILSGGVTQSAIWPQILADIWGRPLQVLDADVPRACLGAAVLAGVGAGIYKDGREALGRREERMVRIEAQDSGPYASLADQYRRLYPLLKEEMHRLQRTAASSH